MVDRLRGLAVGAGYFAHFHLDAWRRVEGADLVALVDADPTKAKEAAAEFGIPACFENFEQALDVTEPDFVDIITPPASHLELVRIAASRGVAIICQKPLAPDFAKARQLVHAADGAGVRLMVHENFRFQPWHRELKRLLDDGVIGDKLHSLTFRTRTGDGWGADAYLARQPYFREMPRLLMHETGVHFIDTFRFLAGEVDSTQSVLRRLNPVIVGEDTGLVILQFANGAVGLWDANRFNETTDENPRLTFGEFLIEGDGGSLRLFGDGRITIQPLGERERDHEYHFSTRGFAGDCVRATQQHFVDSIHTGAPFETSGADYLQTLNIVEAIYRSSQLGQSVVLKQDSRRRMVDLTRPVEAKVPGVAISEAKTIDRDGWNATTLSLYSHSGTHMDAPRHFIKGDSSLEDLDLSICFGPASVIDLTPVQPSESLTVERLGDWVHRIGRGDRLLLRTDWHKRYPAAEYREELPRISLELAEWLVEQGVALIGVEPPSVADVNNMAELTAVHQTFFRGGVTIVEGLMNLDQLDAELVEFTVLPLRIVDGDGSPVRAVAEIC